VGSVFVVASPNGAPETRTGSLIGMQWGNELRALAERHTLIGDVRGQGLMIGIELVRDRRTKEPATDEAIQVRALCREAGVLIGVGGQFGNVLRIQPPLVITRQELEDAIGVLGRVLESIVPASPYRSS
jgi:4-aminobutyrate aminotransferase-like enzyme